MERLAIQELPKIDLHCHLDGSLSLELVRELLGREVQPEELMAEDDCGSLAEYLERFDLPLQCLQTADGLRRAGHDFIRQVAKENVRYVEVRFAPQFSVNERLDVGKVIEAVLEGLAWGRQEYGVESQVIVCAMRHLSEEENLRMLTAAREFLGHGVCAADLAGDEAAFPMKRFLNLFAEVRRMGMPFTIHAGECGSAENIEEAVRCGAMRIGHGIALRGRSQIQKLCVERDVGIELCPVSNHQTKAVKRGEPYPIREFLEAGLLVTLNTDNRTVSHTSLSREIAFVQEHCGVSDADIVQMQENALRAAFLDEQKKEQIRHCLLGRGKVQ